MFRHGDGLLFSARTWSMWIIFFLPNLIFSGTLSFLFGRAVKINIQVAVSLVIVTLFSIWNFHFLFLQHQHSDYQEVAVIGDLSDGDLNQANAIQDPFKVIRISLSIAIS